MYRGDDKTEIFMLEKTLCTFRPQMGLPELDSADDVEISRVSFAQGFKLPPAIPEIDIGVISVLDPVDVVVIRYGDPLESETRVSGAHQLCRGIAVK